MVNVDENPPLRERDVPAGWPGMRGKRVLVTGGTRGLGESVVRLLLAEGAQVATCARERVGLTALEGSLAGAQRDRLFTDRLDVTEPGRLEDFVTTAAKRFVAAGPAGCAGPAAPDGPAGPAGPAGFDGVVACVGGSRGGTFEQADGADWAATWELNVGHTARLVRAALPFLRAADGGSVVLVGSISGWKPGPPAQYGAAKSALIHLAASLARELGPDRIRVNAVSPGSMLIPGRRWDRMRREDPPAYENFAGAELPSGAPVTPHEVARTVVFLLSDWATGVSGAHLPVDRAQNAPSPDGY
ncbi:MULTISPECIES: SDR family NAD(P)-dependent oxidoreductase [Streptomyces]|uniref:NAD(P)-dependent dehydrogenase (Short-subunit alcohol dehydrogenase family) n=1 Tax=Streptomyces stelliscabiei TaxID=146820 RepID=A0A8I0NZP4_9ACTN|nr:MULTISPECIES: SDR family oxidoreductase [Streptomyces]KND43213.1 3-oxoacyl-ACP reductase [Streptomyces stelliscabiei]MBE1594759.1 NAD(P)-dependent dehydrogenase (short-subunit alcohol dehydrogenase family) [Streptomyces stelliscabiei]MDX2519040.1 SDR family NAD(P)-dependent oxidoreductase [Streptomyces stelliscabiei]SOD82283.1 3-oxoacyl-[acyl-carrier protein] reductase [Streptomyces sp. 1222.2]